MPSGTYARSRSARGCRRPRGPIAAIVRGRRSPSFAIRVRSRSHANAATSRGNPVGRFSGSIDDVRATSAISCSLSWPLNDGIAPDRSWPGRRRARRRASRRRGSGRRCRRSGCLERVATAASGGGKDLLAVRCIALYVRGRLLARRGLGRGRRDGAFDGLGRGALPRRRRSRQPAGKDQGEQHEQRGGAAHRRQA